MTNSAVGEPPLCMSIVVLFALRHALNSSRRDSGISNDTYYDLGAPSTSEKIFLTGNTKPEAFLLYEAWDLHIHRPSSMPRLKTKHVDFNCVFFENQLLWNSPYGHWRCIMWYLKNVMFQAFIWWWFWLFLFTKYPLNIEIFYQL